MGIHTSKKNKLNVKKLKFIASITLHILKKTFYRSLINKIKFKNKSIIKIYNTQQMDTILEEYIFYK